MTRRRLWLFRLGALLVVPTLLLLLLEFSLRVFGFGYPADFALKTRVEGREVFTQNRRFGWRFFPKDIARTPVPFVIPAEKPAGAYRIFILGASAALGVPDHTFSFGRILDVQLRARYPGVDFEVVNAAAVAINSHVVREIARDCVELQPDLFVVYLGNNEVVGPFGAGTVFTPLSPSLAAIRAGLRLKSTRVGQLMQRVAAAVSTAPAPRSWTGLSMFMERQVRADAPDLEIVYEHFRQNLADLCGAARARGVPVIVCTVPTNLKDCPPFASLHRAELKDEQLRAWATTYGEAVILESRGDYAAALERYRAAEQADDRYAEMHFRMGRCYWAVGDYQAARQCFVKARDLDTLRFRADTRINAVIRATAGPGGVPGVELVDAERALAESSPHGTPGEELFHEHVHLNFSGNFLVATAIRQRLETLLPVWIQRKAKGDRSLSEAQCAARLAFTAWDRYRVVRKVLNNYIKAPPFTNQLYQDERLRRFERRLDELESCLSPESLGVARAQYEEALRRNEKDAWLHLNYAGFLMSAARDAAAAERHLRAFLRTFPDYPDALDKLATILMQRGAYDEAVALCRKTLELSPNKAAALSRLGNALRAQGRLDEALECYRAALRVKPGYAEATRGLAATLLDVGKTDEGMSLYRQGLGGAADSAEEHYRQALALRKTGRLDEALEHLRRAARLKPEWPAPAASLAWALATAPVAKYRNGPEAVRFGERACQASGYQDPRLLDVLAAAYAEAGRFSDAVETERKALALTAPGDADSLGERKRRLELYRQGRPYRVRGPSGP